MVNRIERIFRAIQRSRQRMERAETAWRAQSGELAASRPPLAVLRVEKRFMTRAWRAIGKLLRGLETGDTKNESTKNVPLADTAYLPRIGGNAFKIYEAARVGRILSGDAKESIGKACGIKSKSTVKKALFELQSVGLARVVADGKHLISWTMAEPEMKLTEGAGKYYRGIMDTKFHGHIEKAEELRQEIREIEDEVGLKPLELPTVEIPHDKSVAWEHWEQADPRINAERYARYVEIMKDLVPPKAEIEQTRETWEQLVAEFPRLRSTYSKQHIDVALEAYPDFREVYIRHFDLIHLHVWHQDVSRFIAEYERIYPTANF